MLERGLFGDELEIGLFGDELEIALFGMDVNSFTDQSNRISAGVFVDQTNIYTSTTPVPGGVGLLYYFMQQG